MDRMDMMYRVRSEHTNGSEKTNGLACVAVRIPPCCE
ncbi:hypothetical protein LU11_gp180 [Pseudomonas phage Lu11]|nr:hypothetical protein LU11_gp180 [Pseudomonas phage Lu11]AFH14711.1 hypothetical protein Lu11_0175A [Pseudomonas phage Lu11]